MPGFVNVLVIIAVVALIVVRQVRPQPATGGKRRWVVPAVLVCLALREPGMIDAQHRTASVALLAVELLVGLAMGAAWAWTSRLWAESDGTVWVRGTKSTVFVWVGGIALRAGLLGVGALLGIHQGTGALLLALASSLLVRSGVLAWRAQSMRPAPAGAAGYRGEVPVVSWKDRV